MLASNVVSKNIAAILKIQRVNRSACEQYRTWSMIRLFPPVFWSDVRRPTLVPGVICPILTMNVFRIPGEKSPARRPCCCSVGSPRRPKKASTKCPLSKFCREWQDQKKWAEAAGARRRHGVAACCRARPFATGALSTTAAPSSAATLSPSWWSRRRWALVASRCWRR